MPSTYLAHHGILGQKWGVRRYQNPDGSLTEAGKKRYLKADDSFTNDAQRRKKIASIAKGVSKSLNELDDVSKRRSIKAISKHTQGMSNEDLQRSTRDATLRNQYMKSRGIENKYSIKTKYSEMSRIADQFSTAADTVAKRDEKRVASETAKRAKNMSDEDLRKAIARMSLEDQYRNLSKKDRDAGADYVYNHKRELINDLVTYSTPFVLAGINFYLLNRK